ncbi:TrkH-domain-containing protein [Aulographum hederae CBS 113979]|uniref:Potassium transport protein n=1 Tax=Aulographum hederae CBS 113979 TaxID=1176131 RepID=A0A6G1GSC3_9PEZI|nr:TrkH-domain-containing protein [Aulographum hederae CBS 113979]
MAFFLRKAVASTRPVTRTVRRVFRDVNFIQLHYMYFVTLGLLSALILWGSATPFGSLNFTNSLFLTFSAMTEAGLNTVNLSTLNTWQQVLLFFLIMLGSPILVSSSVVHVRKAALEAKCIEVLEQSAKKLHKNRWILRSRTVTRRPSALDGVKEPRNTEGLDAADEPDDGLETGPSGESEESNEKRKNSSDDSSKSRLEQPVDGTDADFPHAVSAALHALTTEHTPEQEQGQEPDAAPGVTFAPMPSFRPQPPSRMLSSEGIRPRSRRRSISRSVLQHVFATQGVGALPYASRRTSQVLYTPSEISRAPTMERLAEIPRGPSMSRSTTIPPNEHINLDRIPSRLRDLNSGFEGRNLNFNQLSQKDRETIGGAEYEAVRFLSFLVPAYYIMWQLLSALALGAYINAYHAQSSYENGLKPWWVGSFLAVSAFNNCGMMLLDANMVAYQKDVYILLTVAMLVLAGNTFFPILLRFIIWCFSKMVPKSEEWANERATLKFLLDHPRRCFTHLFPSQHTWWLLLTVLVLNFVDCCMFIILDIGNHAITDLGPGFEFMDALFQAIAVRSGGFYVVAISSIRASLQVLYVAMMYISAYPVLITIRNSNIYEERSLGIYADDPGFAAYEEQQQREGHKGVGASLVRAVKKRFLFQQKGIGANDTGIKVTQTSPENKAYFISQQLRAQLAHDVWWLILAIFLIMIIEGGAFETDPTVFSVFNVIFETVSAYATVGLSIGVPWADYSFSGSWRVLSKLVLVIVMLRGRHRGLPVAIDKAVMLPSEQLWEFEEEDAAMRANQSMSRSRRVSVSSPRQAAEAGMV